MEGHGKPLGRCAAQARPQEQFLCCKEQDLGCKARSTACIPSAPLLVYRRKENQGPLYHKWLQYSVCAINMLNSHYHYHNSQTYKVCEIEFFSDGSEEEVYGDDSKCVSSPKEQDMQLGEVKETAQDAEENEEAVRDDPSDSSSSEGGRPRSETKVKEKGLPCRREC